MKFYRLVWVNEESEEQGGGDVFAEVDRAGLLWMARTMGAQYPYIRHQVIEVDETGEAIQESDTNEQ